MNDDTLKRKIRRLEADLMAKDAEAERAMARHRADLKKANDTTQVVRNRAGELEAELEDVRGERDEAKEAEAMSHSETLQTIEILEQEREAAKVVKAELEATRGQLWEVVMASGEALGLLREMIDNPAAQLVLIHRAQSLLDRISAAGWAAPDARSDQPIPSNGDGLAKSV
ncbi:hypothetical protein LCGC14_0820570 [marine sediment metagenome]|uniref:Uncharacterized protein n=1 Tax=marine sediment metagenome TaxID=412755 RepID=A0A0F9SRM2_9ZZZZ